MAIVPSDVNPHDLAVGGDVFLDSTKADHIQAMCVKLAKADIVPAHLRGKPENLFIIISSALSNGADPWQAIQRTFVVHGRLGIEAQYAIALANTRGPFTTPINYREDRNGTTAYALGKNGEEYNYLLTREEVVKAGWNSDPWKKMTRLMMRYRAATYLIRTTCPQVMLGMYTTDELVDMGPPSTMTQNAKTVSDVLGESTESTSSRDAIDQETPSRVDYAALIAAAEDRDRLEAIYRQAKADKSVKAAALKSIAAQCKARIDQFATSSVDATEYHDRIESTDDIPALRRIASEIDSSSLADADRDILLQGIDNKINSLESDPGATGWDTDPT